MKQFIPNLIMAAAFFGILISTNITCNLSDKDNEQEYLLRMPPPSIEPEPFDNDEEHIDPFIPDSDSLSDYYSNLLKASEVEFLSDFQPGEFLEFIAVIGFENDKTTVTTIFSSSNREELIKSIHTHYRINQGCNNDEARLTRL